MTYEYVKREVSRDQLYQWLYHDNLTYRAIMNKYGYQERLISRLATEFGFKYSTKTRSLTHCKKEFHNNDQQRDYIINRYVNDKASARQIAKEFHCAHAVILKLLHDNNVSVRSAHDIDNYDTRRRKDIHTSETADSAGYKLVRKCGYKDREHRYIMEQVLGRPLKPEECVHHIDFDKTNNDPANLFCFATNSLHHLYHGYLRKFDYISPQEFVGIYKKQIEWFYSYDTLYDLYITQSLSCNQIAKMYTEITTRHSVSKTLKKMGIYDLRPPTINQVA